MHIKFWILKKGIIQNPRDHDMAFCLCTIQEMNNVSKVDIPWITIHFFYNSHSALFQENYFIWWTSALLLSTCSLKHILVTISIVQLNSKFSINSRVKPKHLVKIVKNQMVSINLLLNVNKNKLKNSLFWVTILYAFTFIGRHSTLWKHCLNSVLSHMLPLTLFPSDRLPLCNRTHLAAEGHVGFSSDISFTQLLQAEGILQ